MNMKTYLLPALLASMLLLLSAPVSAQDNYKWTGAASDNNWWGGNWLVNSDDGQIWLDNNKAIFDDTASGGMVTITTNPVYATSVNVDGTKSWTISGSDINVLAGGGSLAKSGSGELTLSGSNHTYTGGTTVSGGKLYLSYNSGANGTIGGSLAIGAGAEVITTVANAFGYTGGTQVTSVTINEGTLTHSGGGDCGWGVTYNLTGATMNASSGQFSFGGGTSINVFASDTTTEIKGNVVLREGNTDNTIVFNVARGTATTDLLVSAAMVGVDGRGLTKTGDGIMAITGAPSYTGKTIVTGGTLDMGNNSYGSGAGYEISNGATLIFAGGQRSHGNLTTLFAFGTGGGNVQINDGNFYPAHDVDITTSADTSTISGAAGINLNGKLITFDMQGTSELLFSAVIWGDQDNLTTGIAKKGTGTMVLSGANTYTGDTTMKDGILSLGAGWSHTASTTYQYIFDADPGTNATLQFSGATTALTRDVLLTTDGTIDVTNGKTGTITSNITGNGTLTKTGRGTLVLSGDNNGFDGDSTISEGKIRLEAGNLGTGKLTVDLVVDTGVTPPVKKYGTLEFAQQGLVLNNSEMEIFGTLRFDIEGPLTNADTIPLVTLDDADFTWGTSFGIDLSGLFELVDTDEDIYLFSSNKDFGELVTEWDSHLSGYGTQYWTLDYRNLGDSMNPRWGLFATQVPEPATWLLLLLGGATMVVARRRKK